MKYKLICDVVAPTEDRGEKEISKETIFELVRYNQKNEAVILRQLDSGFGWGVRIEEFKTFFKEVNKNESKI